MKLMKGFRQRFSVRVFFRSGEVKKFFAEKGAAKGYYKLLLHNLAKKGEIKRLKKGVYTFGPASVNLSSIFSPAYHGLQEALSIHKIWNQATNQIIITPRKVRSGERLVLGRKVIVRRIARKMFFGAEMLNYAGEWIEVSDPEKTLIDFYYFREPLDKDTRRALLRKIDVKKLEAYLKMCPDATRRHMARLTKNILKKRTKKSQFLRFQLRTPPLADTKDE
ncbi:Uncharacterised protein [uncultured archaeon]|nr:Uncharacterised protein [uncultured archaeon]